MNKLVSALVVLLLLAPLAVFASGADEQVIEIEEEEQGQFEGVVDIDYSSWERGKPGGRIIIPSLSDPKTFNTVTANETSSTDITDRMYIGAVRRNQLTLEWEPWAAESYEVSDDQKTITFKLREDIYWSDGEQLTASDFVDAVNLVYYNEEIDGAASTRNALSGAGGPAVFELIDEFTYSVTLPNVYAGIYNMNTIQALPMHVFGPLIEAGGGDAVDSFWGVDSDVTEIVGSGPFLIEEYVPGERVVMVKNDLYFEKDEWGQALPYLDEIVFRIIPDQDTQLTAFLNGEIDFLGVRGEDYAIVVEEKSNVGFEMYNVGPASSTQFITFNQNPIEGEGDNGISEPELTWLSNKTFRQAMAHLVDRESIINNIAFGFGYPQYSFVPRFSPYYWEDADTTAFPYDPNTAAEMLDSIDYIDRDGDGWREDPDGNKISLDLATNSGNRVREAIGQLFTQDAAAVGIEINFNPGDFNAMVTQLVDTYDWELILIGLTGSLDPISGVNVYPSDGNLHMIEPLQESPRREWEAEVDAAWEVANFTTDEDQRKEGWQIIQEIWIEEVPWVFTFNAAIMHAYGVEFGNIKPHPIDGYGFGGIVPRMYLK